MVEHIVPVVVVLWECCTLKIFLWEVVLNCRTSSAPALCDSIFAAVRIEIGILPPMHRTSPNRYQTAPAGRDAGEAAGIALLYSVRLVVSRLSVSRCGVLSRDLRIFYCVIVRNRAS